MAKAKSYAPGAIGRATAEPSSAPPPAMVAGGQTSHISVIDRRGNAVSVTNSVGSLFGSAVVAPGTGFPLNDTANVQGDDAGPNAAGGGKRPRSAQAPAILARDDGTLFVVGGAGFVLIPMGTVQSISNAVDFGHDPARAVDAARVQEFTCCAMSVEQWRVLPDVLAALRERGHQIQGAAQEYGPLPVMQVAATDTGRGGNLAVSDPREERGAAGQGDGQSGLRGRPFRLSIHAYRRTWRHRLLRQGIRVGVRPSAPADLVGVITAPLGANRASVTLARVKRSSAPAGRLKLTLRPTRRGRAYLSRRGRPIRAAVTITATATGGGDKRTLSRRLVIL